MSYCMPLKQSAHRARHTWENKIIHLLARVELATGNISGECLQAQTVWSNKAEHSRQYWSLGKSTQLRSIRM